MNDNTRTILGVILLVVAFFMGGDGGIITPVAPKLDKPDAQIVELVDDLAEVSGEASNKAAGTFYAVHDNFDKLGIDNSLELQYFLDYIGKNVLKGDVGEVSPTFSKSAADIIVKVTGPQTESGAFTEGERATLKKLFYGFAWKLYDKNYEEVFEAYKVEANNAIKEYLGDEDVDPEVEDCPCNGKGYIIHGDGHRSTCPCIEAGQGCDHDPKCGSKGSMAAKPAGHKCQCDQPGMRCGCFDKYGRCDCPTLTSSSTSTTYSSGCATGNCSTVKKKYVGVGYANLPNVPNLTSYRPRVGVKGMTVRYHLITGAPNHHNAVPSSYVDSLTLNQQYWLHDYLHGYNRG